ncbi:MAG: DUF934 domain-containing protein [Proteobacteria bacterium]|nr:DUF934 domain-containing protein [Pseudomonadota bacterium]
MHLLTTPTPLPDLATWRAQGGPGFHLANTDDVQELTPADLSAAVIALTFPAWTDGRAYSQAHVLRSQLGYGGDLRATGQVLVDMAPLLARSGFASAELAAGQNPTHAHRALQWQAGFYQANYAALEVAA